MPVTQERELSARGRAVMEPGASEYPGRDNPGAVEREAWEGFQTAHGRFRPGSAQKAPCRGCGRCSCGKTR